MGSKFEQVLEGILQESAFQLSGVLRLGVLGFWARAFFNFPDYNHLPLTLFSGLLVFLNETLI